jgi:Uma2 family endonuclease
VGDRALVTVQNPVRLGDISEPQPDLAVVRPKDDQYAAGHPRPQDVLLLVEVADSTVGFDRGDKAPLYAAYGIPEYWLVDIPGDHIEVFRGPTPDGWGETSRHRRGDTLRPQALPELAVPVDAVLG